MSLTALFIELGRDNEYAISAFEHREANVFSCKFCAETYFISLYFFYFLIVFSISPCVFYSVLPSLFLIIYPCLFFV